MNICCHFCGSKNFIDERLADGKFTSCCRKGRVKLPKPVDINGVELPYPELLRNLLTDTKNPDHENFKENIRQYNNAVSFASLGAKTVEFPGRGQYVFKVCALLTFKALIHKNLHQISRFMVKLITEHHIFNRRMVNNHNSLSFTFLTVPKPTTSEKIMQPMRIAEERFLTNWITS